MSHKKSTVDAAEEPAAHAALPGDPVIERAQEPKELPAIRPARGAIKAVSLVKSLTPPLVAMAHVDDLLFEPLGEMRIMSIPVKGRSEKIGDAIVLDGINCETEEQIILILNTMMVRAFTDAGKEASIIGRTFGLKNADMAADKNYRIVNVVEVQVERDPVVTQ